MFHSIFINIGFLVILLLGIREITKESKLFNKRLIIILDWFLVVANDSSMG
ncbi:hypothetical protein [Alkaliphilus metalliredigens]|uniref:hypothetical protein n=1 Tax=Alkaliphilus metalliredigens TaxID=208226 RepID=UPI0012EE9890|nr:hypothetical protein [Alkaliphilus metalliredigens]